MPPPFIFRHYLISATTITTMYSTNGGSTSPLRSVSPRPSDPIVKIELEAAEALACLAQSSAVDTPPADDVEDCCTVKSERSPRPINKSSGGDDDLAIPSGRVGATDILLGSRRGVEQSFCLYQGQVLGDEQNGKNVPHMMTEPVQAPQDPELHPIPVASTCCGPSTGSRSRNNMNEAEKEARKIRRVLANRESARQTIRRRQAFYEELTRKAATLACENENLKKEKEVAMKEFDSLRSTNESLKAEMTKIAKIEVEESREDLHFSHADAPTSPSTSYPVCFYNHPSLFPFLWPAVIPPPNAVHLQCVPQNSIPVVSQVPLPSQDKLHSFPEHGSSTRINVSGTPLYTLPYPWLFPFSHHANGIHSLSFNSPDKHKEFSTNNQSSYCSSSRATAHVESHHLCTPVPVRNEVSNSAELVPAVNLYENKFTILPNEEDQHVVRKCGGFVLVPAQISHVKPAAAVDHNDLPRQPKISYELRGTSRTAINVTNTSPEHSEEPVVPMSKRQMDAVAAAKARKRRKELKKLKNLYLRENTYDLSSYQAKI